jgi:hypothetical protein
MSYLWLKFATDLSCRQGFRDGFTIEKATVDNLFKHIDEIMEIAGIRKR